MTLTTVVLSALALLVLSGVFSGSEIGFYSVPRLRIEAEARSGRIAARLIRYLLQDDTGLLITVLIGNNLTIELLTHLAEAQVVAIDRIPDWGRELAVTLSLTPVLFFLGELLPKDLFHRRPYLWTRMTAPFILVLKYLFWPLAVPLRASARLLERALRLDDTSMARALGRDSVEEFLDEVLRHGALAPHAGELARNALELRTRTLANEMVSWDAVVSLPLEADPATQRRIVAEATLSRLPVVDGAGGIRGYVHQLDVLGGEPDAPIETFLRPVLALSPDTSVEQALTRLRRGGHRLAVVGSPEQPQGLISLKDLVETISGELAAW